MNSADRLRNWMEGWFGKLAAIGFLLMSLFCATILVWMVCEGKPYAHVFYSDHPLRFLCGAIFGWLAWHTLRHGMAYGRNDWKLFAGKVLMAVLSAIFSLTAAEIGLRYHLWHRQSMNSIERLKEFKTKGKQPRIKGSHPMVAVVEPSADTKVIFELQPNLSTNFGHRILRINAAGIRADREYSISRRPNSVRIVGIGDSGMFGWDTDQNMNYVAQLEARLNERADGVSYEAINLGVPGYNTRQEVEMLRYKGLAYKPDVVIVGWCENDYQLPFCMAEEQNFRRRDVSFLYELMFRREHFADIGLGQLYDQREFKTKEAAEYIRAGGGAKGVEEALKDIKAMGKREGFHVLVFGPMKETIVGICERVGLEYFNTREKIRSEEYPESYRIHAMHPSPDGHRILAEYLEKALDEKGWLKPR